MPPSTSGGFFCVRRGGEHSPSCGVRALRQAVGSAERAALLPQRQGGGRKIKNVDHTPLGGEGAAGRWRIGGAVAGQLGGQ